MQSFNFFLVATAFLVAGYGAVLSEHRIIAVGIALLGAWVSLWFNRMEKRTKQLVKAGEAALAPFQHRLAELTANPSLVILPSVERAAAGCSSYSRVIDVIEWTIFVAFLSGAIYAGWPLLPGLCQASWSAVR
jgi:hypothetical protein